MTQDMSKLVGENVELQPAQKTIGSASPEELEACVQNGKLPGTLAPSQEVPQARVMLLVGGHALCASSLLVINKMALKTFPFVWTLTTLQFLFAALVTYIAGKLGIIHVDALDKDKLIRFFPAAGMFFITITAGNAVVGVSNVDTFIVMRSLVPIPSALLESLVLGEPCPAPKSWIGLITILLGAVVYCSVNRGFLVESTAWVLLYLALMPLDGVLIKHIVNESGLSPWGLVLYNNLCAAVPGLFFSIVLELCDSKTLPQIAGSLDNLLNVVPIAVSCWSGLAISFFQLNVRKTISSTAFMVLGVSNKFISVLMNQLTRLDTNNDLKSIGSVLIAIAGAILFQQTVKGNGISQTQQTEIQGGNRWGWLFVVVGVVVAAGISISQKHG